MNKKISFNIKLCIVFLILFSLIFSSLTGCNKKVVVNKDNNETTAKLNLPGETITISGKVQVRLDNVSVIKAIKINNSLNNATYLTSYVYLLRTKVDTRIVKIKKDGSTIDTIVERKESSIYPNAYIVEKGGDLSKTTAKYVLDYQKSIIIPKSSTESFAAVNFYIKNISRKKILLKDLKLSLITDNGLENKLDLIFTDIVLDESFMPDLDANKSYSVRLLTLIPGNTKQIIFNCEGTKFKWEPKK